MADLPVEAAWGLVEVEVDAREDAAGGVGRVGHIPEHLHVAPREPAALILVVDASQVERVVSELSSPVRMVLGIFVQ